MLNITSIMLGTDSPKQLGEFYAKVFGKDADMVDEGGMYGWQMGTLNFSIGLHSEVKGKSKQPERVIFNLETEDVQGEFDRIKEFATVIKEPYTMEGWENFPIATLADPDGNYFQLMSPWDGVAE